MNEFLGCSFPSLHTPVKKTAPAPVKDEYHYFETREDARIYCGANGIVQSAIHKNHSLAPKSRRWFL